MEELKYKVFDTNIEIDTFIGLDEKETAVYESLVSIDKYEIPFCYGCYDNKIDIEQFLLNLKKKYTNELNNKRILFIRSINNFEKEYKDELEIKKAINLFRKINDIFIESKCYFLLAFSKPLRPMLLDNMFYAHIKINNDGKPKEFERVVMSRLGKLVQNQNNTDLKPLREKGFYAQTLSINKVEDIEIIYNEIAYSISKHNVPFEFFCNFKQNSDILVVFGQSALNQSVVKLPAYRRWSWTRELPYSCIVLNDPTLYKSKDLEAGWFIGDKEHHYAKSMSEIISVLAQKLNIPLTRVILIGASAGGFSSMAIGSYLKGSSCVVDVPQTNLLTYMFQKEIDKIAISCFGVSKIKDIIVQYSERFVLSELFKKNRYIPNIYYLQNSNDMTAGHVLTQFNNFIQEVNSLIYSNSDFRNTKIITELYSKNHLLKGGHFPLGNFLTIFYLKEAIKKFIDKDYYE